MQDEELNSLITKYMNGEATESEQKLIDDWYNAFDAKQGLLARMDEDEKAKAVNKSFDAFKSKLQTLS